MAYDKEEIYKSAVLAIANDPDIVFVEDVICETGVSKACFYKFFPPESDELNNIKALLLVNSAKIKRGMRKNWKFEDASAALQVSLYKLLGTKEEREALNNDTNKGDAAPPVIKIENYIPLKPDNEG